MKERPYQPWSKVKANIVVRYTQRNHLDEVRECKDEIGSMSEFSNFLRWAPDKAMMLGYTKPDEEVLSKSRNSNLRLSIRYGTMAMENEVHFKDVYELNKFLIENKEIAKALQYVPSKPESKHRPRQKSGDNKDGQNNAEGNDKAAS